MARTISKTKTSRVNRATKPVAATDVSAYGRDLDRWPRSWMGLEKDLLPGEQLLALLSALHRTPGIVDSFPQDHSPACGQPLDVGRRDHPRPTLRPFSKKDGCLSLIHISEPTRLGMISYAVF